MKTQQEQYEAIVIDPPWPGPGEARSLKGGSQVNLIPYSTMTGIQIAEMPIGEIATASAQLWIWATSRSISDAERLLQLWGFAYGGLFIWRKPPGLGLRVRHDSEFLLHGVRKNAHLRLPAPPQTHRWPRPKRHSEKPSEAYEMIRRQSAEPRIDIFARQSRPGFEAWGNQAPKS